VLEGSPNRDVICGLGGNDILKGLSGDDKVTANGGSDDLFREEVDDTLDSKDGVAGNDSLDGRDDAATCTTDAPEKSSSAVRTRQRPR
jgi:hypothetical protein